MGPNDFDKFSDYEYPDIEDDPDFYNDWDDDDDLDWYWYEREDDY